MEWLRRFAPVWRHAYSIPKFARGVPDADAGTETSPLEPEPVHTGGGKRHMPAFRLLSPLSPPYFC